VFLYVLLDQDDPNFLLGLQLLPFYFGFKLMEKMICRHDSKMRVKTIVTMTTQAETSSNMVISIDIGDSINKAGKKRELSVIENLNQIEQLPESIKAEAERICNMMIHQKQVRGTNRTQLIFYCLYEAQKNIGKEPPNPHQIADLVGLSHRDIAKAISRNSFRGYRHKNVVMKANDFIEPFCRWTPISDASGNIEEINDLLNEILSKNVEIHNSSPQDVAAGIIYYFMEINGIITDDNSTEVLDAFSEGISIQKKLISDMKEEIERIDNE
jgi:transcription initiation factor TFIIIB Brf1 subunit/transcription initiation factor TFIIB